MVADELVGGFSINIINVAIFIEASFYKTPSYQACIYVILPAAITKGPFPAERFSFLPHCEQQHAKILPDGVAPASFSSSLISDMFGMFSL